MSLTSQAIITVARNLIRGRTWAGSNVAESPVDPISDIVNQSKTGKMPPYIAVYIERMSAEDGKRGDADLKIYIYLPPDEMTVPEGVTYAPGRHIAGMTLNLLARQVENALAITIDPWSEIWRRLATTSGERVFRPLLLEIENGIRIPALEMSMSIKTAAEPEIGSPMGKTFTLLDTALRENGDDIIADLFQAAIENPADLPDYLDAEMQLGMTRATVDALGIGPVTADAVDEDGNIPPLADVDYIDPE